MARGKRTSKKYEKYKLEGRKEKNKKRRIENRKKKLLKAAEKKNRLTKA